MGSSSHNEDLELVCPVLEQILDEMPHVRFEVFGSIKVPDRLAGKIAHRHEPIPNYDAFLRRLASLQWDIGIAPLRLTSFNLAKTNTKWVEYAAAGIPVVSSRHPVYSKIAAGDGLIEAEGPAEWYSALSNLILDEGSRQSLRCHAMALLERKYSVRHLTVQVAAVLSAVGLSQRTGILCQCQNNIDRSQG